MDHILTEEANLVNLSHAIQTNDLEKILEYKALCRSDILLLHSNNQVRMPAIALAIQTVCSEVKPSDYNYPPDQKEVIKLLITQCGVDPNAPFRIYGETRPTSRPRGGSTDDPIQESTDPSYFEEYFPLSLLLSYCIKYLEVDGSVILRCMQQLIQLGGSLSAAYYVVNNKKGSLLMAALQYGLHGYMGRVDFFRFFLENGATFSEMDEAPLAQYALNRYGDCIQVLDLFYKYYIKRQITHKQITDSYYYYGDEKHDAMYIWCRSEPLTELENLHAMNLFLAMGFDPQSGKDGIEDQLWEDRTALENIENLKASLELAIENRRKIEDERMGNVNVLQGLESNGLPVELQDSVFQFTKGVNAESHLARARRAFQRHSATLARGPNN